jgi:hypothetical protein
VATSPLLTLDECRAVIADCAADAWRASTVGYATSEQALAGAAPLRRVDPDTKRAVEQGLPGGPDGWLAARIAARVGEINSEIYHFRIVAMEEPARVVWYRGDQGDRFDRHIDIGPQTSLRKLGFSLLLSDPASFTGGDLVFGDSPVMPTRAQGVLTVFPSFLTHSVTPMTRGDRFIAVGWATGPAFV